MKKNCIIDRCLLIEEKLELSSDLESKINKVASKVSVSDSVFAATLKLAKHIPNVIVVDSTGCFDDVVEFFKWLKTKPEYAKIPVVGIDKDFSQSTLFKVVDMGVRDYIPYEDIDDKLLPAIIKACADMVTRPKVYVFKEPLQAQVYVEMNVLNIGSSMCDLTVPVKFSNKNIGVILKNIVGNKFNKTMSRVENIHGVMVGDGLYHYRIRWTGIASVIKNELKDIIQRWRFR